jgi:hypothetical protein
LDTDGYSLELRRIVISDKSKGYGKKAIFLIDKLVEREFRRTRIWLDVFENNDRNQQIYKQNEYCYSDSVINLGKDVKFFKKN